jgi:glycosyltransferase involved in cell wall biosynthesis
MDAKVTLPRKHRLLVITARVAATQVISFVQPLARRPDIVEHLEVVAYEQPRFAELAQESYWRDDRPSALILSRAADAGVFRILDLARRFGVPSILHLDDDLLDVNESLDPVRLEYCQRPERLEDLQAAIDLVDLVYASTPALARRMAEHGIVRRIVAGEIYCSVDPDDFGNPHPATGPVFGYMGNAGHSEDLALIVPTIVRLMREMPDLRFETFGAIAPPPELVEFGTRYGHHSGFEDYPGFMARLNQLGWWVGLAPLCDTAFNRCKADTKWVEYSVAGTAVVASDLPVYRRACAEGCGVLAGTRDAWYSSLSDLLRNADRRAAMVSAARQKLAAAYSHDILRQQIISIIGHATTECAGAVVEA